MNVISTQESRLYWIGFCDFPIERVVRIDYSVLSLQKISSGPFLVTYSPSFYKEDTPIFLYENGELIAHGTLFGEQGETSLTLDVESFGGYLEGKTYTVKIGENEPTEGMFIENQLMSEHFFTIAALNSQIAILNTRNFEVPCSSLSIAQRKTTTEKKYDIKLLPDDLLPKTAARKADVAKVRALANEAYDYADIAWNSADIAKNNAATAQSTAETAQSTAETAQSTANETALWSSAISTSNINTTIELTSGEYSTLNGYHLIYGRVYSVNGTSFNVQWSGRAMGVSLVPGYVSIEWRAERGAYKVVVTNVSVAKLTGVFAPAASRDSYNLRAKTLPPNVVFPYLLLASQTANSSKLFKVTMDDTGTFSAVETTST